MALKLGGIQYANAQLLQYDAKSRNGLLVSHSGICLLVCGIGSTKLANTVAPCSIHLSTAMAASPTTKKDGNIEKQFLLTVKRGNCSPLITVERG
jgi:hypothetical protein